jgi:hypothetical protein
MPTRLLGSGCFNILFIKNLFVHLQYAKECFRRFFLLVFIRKYFGQINFDREHI